MVIDTHTPNPPNQQSKLRWSELDDDDGEEDLNFLLPPPTVIGPDENGIKKVIKYKIDKDGNKVKSTITTRICKLANTQLNKRAIERRSWSKFGLDESQDIGGRHTMVSTEEIKLERPLPPGSNVEEISIVGDKGTLRVCRTCGKKGEHWTAKCPFRDLAPSPEVFIDKPAVQENVTTTTAPGKTAYVLPIHRGGGERIGQGQETRRRNDENSVRVTNLSEDTREPDLHELFCTFGALSRVFVAIDQKTGMSRRFGFVNFVNREDGERAINKLNGYGYDNLILKVEWATPRPN